MFQRGSGWTVNPYVIVDGVDDLLSFLMHAMRSTYYVNVEDVVKTFEKALSFGVTEVFEPADMPTSRGYLS